MEINNLPEVILGTSSLGNLYTVLPDDVKKAIVGAYIRCVPADTIPFIDTAGKYGAGLALESVGRSLKELQIEPGGVFISNKLGWLRVPLATPQPTFEPGVWNDLKYDAVQKISYEGILECYEQGDQLLGDYCSRFVSVHDPDEYLAAATTKADSYKRYQDILGAYRALNELKADSKISAIGVGAKDWHVIARISQDVKLDWVMIANSMTIHSHPRELIEFMKQLARQQTIIINAAVFNGGFLTGGDFYNYKRVDDANEDGRKLLVWREHFWQICKVFKVSPAAAAIRFGFSAPGVSSVALSAGNPDLIISNMDLNEVIIPADFWRRLYLENLITTDGLQITLN